MALLFTLALILCVGVADALAQRRGQRDKPDHAEQTEEDKARPADHELKPEQPGTPAVAPITAEREDDLGDGRHMKTTVRFSGTGKAYAETKTWTDNNFVGFTGGVLIAYVDANGDVLGMSEMVQFGVDGRAIPGKASTRNDRWNPTVPGELAGKVKSLEVVQTHAPKNRLLEAVRQLRSTSVARALNEAIENGQGGVIREARITVQMLRELLMP